MRALWLAPDVKEGGGPSGRGARQKVRLRRIMLGDFAGIAAQNRAPDRRGRGVLTVVLMKGWSFQVNVKIDLSSNPGSRSLCQRPLGAQLP